MDENIEMVIQNIIHIDKNAVELRKKIDEEVEIKKKELEKKIENLKVNILDKKEIEIKKIQDEELKKIIKEEKSILKGYEVEAEKMENKYKMIKEKFIKEVYKDLFIDEDR
ncbi:MAG: hypothetical protein N2594_02985 [Clostridiales bacterium]|nr:hypothetical protein [Clostridiales bacterium]